MKTYTADEARTKAEEIDAKTTAYDYDPRMTVVLETEEGYKAEVPSAFVLQYGDWILLFAEHHKPTIHHTEELVYVDVVRDNGEVKVLQADKFKPKKPKAKKTPNKKEK